MLNHLAKATEGSAFFLFGGYDRVAILQDGDIVLQDTVIVGTVLGHHELGALEWSLSPEESEGLGPWGASSETGRKSGRFSFKSVSPERCRMARRSWLV